MSGQGSNNNFRPVNPGYFQGRRLFGGNQDLTDRNSGMVVQSNARTIYQFSFNHPGQYNISWGNGASSGHPQAQLGQLTRNPPKTLSAGPFDLVGAWVKATANSNRNRGTGSPSSCSSCECECKCPNCGGNLIPIGTPSN